MVESELRELTKPELALLEALLAEPFQGRTELIRQVPGIRCRRIDEDGSLRLAATGPPAVVHDRVPVTGHALDIDGAPVEVLLHVVDGLLDEIELYRQDTRTVLGLPDPATMSLETLPVVG
jgi:hypothetical protein